MISFKCPQCQKSFNVPDEFAGKKARCKGCSVTLEIPDNEPVAPEVAAPIESRPPMRVRRLIADADAMIKAFAKHPVIKIQSTVGDPPEVYTIDFIVKSLETDKKGRPIAREKHTAEVQLGADYPRVPPVCKMLTPIFHPNIDESHICIGDHWTAGERLVDLVKRIAEMLAYQAYNIRSPLNGEAAMWADLNQEKLPTDPRPMV